MATNRIIYNVQDLFIGTPSGESPEIAGFNIAKRINRVQSVNYDFNVDRTDIGIIGKTQNASRPVIQPPTVTLDFNYFLEGVTNEKRIGFNVDNQSSSSKPIFIRDFFNTGRLLDARNIYLVTNNSSDLDVRGQDLNYDLALSGITGQNPNLIIDPNSPRYGILAFQNAYVSNYSVNVSVGEIPSANVSYVADNVIFFSSGSGVQVPRLNVKSGESFTDGTKIVIPKHFKENGPNVTSRSLIFRPGEITVGIQKQTSTGINFHTETLQSFSLELPLERDSISYLGYKLYADRPLTLPIKSSVSLGLLDKNALSGSFLSEINRDDIYNFTVDFKKNDGTIGLKYLVSGAKFDSTSRSLSIGEHQTSELNFSVEMDLDNYANGIFISGSQVAITGSASTYYPNF